MRSTPHRPLSRRVALAAAGPLALVVAAALAASLAGPATAQTQEAARKKMVGYYEMPFPCGQAWTGTTRSDHSPSSRAIDWNRPDDDGDDVVAAASGTVSVANKTGRTGYGRYVQITHANGEGTLYAHLSAVTVSVGQSVDQGTLIGKVGTTGNSSGPHLHFEERSGPTITAAVFAGQKFAYGATQTSANCVDVPLAANMVGAAAAELVVFRRDKRATFQVQQPGAAPIVIPFGRTTDSPVVGDWDGDGTANVGVRRNDENMFYLSTPAGTTSVQLGDPADRPIAGDWTGDGTFEIGVHRAATGEFFQRLPDGSVVHVYLGDANDIAVTGDWNGDRVTDLGVYDSATATFTLRYQASNGVPWIATVPFGLVGDLPVVGDWDGNGATDLGVWRPSTATFYSRRAPSAKVAARTVSARQFGRPRG
ncbi:MAG: M23 family metallopeptidase [Nocardioides sp.]